MLLRAWANVPSLVPSYQSGKHHEGTKRYPAVCAIVSEMPSVIADDVEDMAFVYPPSSSPRAQGRQKI